jgi:precorrin-6B methylase 2
MNIPQFRWFKRAAMTVLCLGICLEIGLGMSLIATPPAIALTDSVYQIRLNHHSDGIGKFYLGREIARVMGHEGAYWLERPSRSLEEQPHRAIEALNLRPTDVVADIGAGTGYFSVRMSQKVPQGRVIAVDVQPEMVEILQDIGQEKHLANLEPRLGAIDNPMLDPASVDLALMVDAYHEFEFPREMMQGIVQALKSEGRVALIEYRGENPFVPIKALHKMTQRQVKHEMAAVGLVWQETRNDLPQQHLMIFRKSGEQ